MEMYGGMHCVVSMLPLLIKDGLIVAYLGSMIIFFVTAHIGSRQASVSASQDAGKSQPPISSHSTEKILRASVR
jgi:hypothetical protein